MKSLKNVCSFPGLFFTFFHQFSDPIQFYHVTTCSLVMSPIPQYRWVSQLWNSPISSKRLRFCENCQNQYHDDTRQTKNCQNHIVMMPSQYRNCIGVNTWCFVDTRQYQLVSGLSGIVRNWWVLFSIGKYCKSIGRYQSIVRYNKVLSGITKHCQVSQSIFRYHKVLSGTARNCLS